MVDLHFSFIDVGRLCRTDANLVVEHLQPGHQLLHEIRIKKVIEG